MTVVPVAQPVIIPSQLRLRVGYYNALAHTGSLFKLYDRYKKYAYTTEHHASRGAQGLTCSP